MNIWKYVIRLYSHEQIKWRTAANLRTYLPNNTKVWQLISFGRFSDPCVSTTFNFQSLSCTLFRYSNEDNGSDYYESSIIMQLFLLTRLKLNECTEMYQSGVYSTNVLGWNICAFCSFQMRIEEPTFDANIYPSKNPPTHEHRYGNTSIAHLCSKEKKNVLKGLLYRLSCFGYVSLFCVHSWFHCICMWSSLQRNLWSSRSECLALGDRNTYVWFLSFTIS